MAKIVIQSMSLHARRARAKKGKKALLKYFGFPNGPPPKGLLSELFRYWGTLDHYLYGPARNARLRNLIKAGALTVDPPLVVGQRMPKDLSSRRYRILKRHRLLGNLDPAPSPAPPKSAATVKTTSIKDRVKAVAAEMKRTGEIPREIPKDIPRQTFARVLAARIDDPENYRYIGNNLAEWGLWPIANSPLLLPPPKDGD